MSFSGSDVKHMSRALRLADLGKYGVQANPKVGAVIVRDDKVIGEGWHKMDSADHAEVMALKQAENDARGAVCYVTLEPCCHVGKHPACTEALIEAGVARVVYAITDPNPLVNGTGIEFLKNKNIEVEQGLCAKAATKINCGFIKRMNTGMPYVRLKMAMSIDGRTAMADGNSYWITSPHAREDVQLLRASSGAIISSAASVIRDASRLDVRRDDIGDVNQPLRVILDYQGKLQGDERIFQGEVPLLVVAPESSKYTSLKPPSQGRIDLKWLLQELGNRGINDVLVEAGSTLAGSFVNQGLIDVMILYMAPKIMGDSAKGLLGIDIPSMKATLPMRIEEVRRIGQDMKFTLLPEKE